MVYATVYVIVGIVYITLAYQQFILKKMSCCVFETVFSLYFYVIVKRNYHFI